jgi:tetratricopeptide (TPR) repeat protein
LEPGSWSLGAILVVLVLVTYLPSIGNEFVNYDDGVYVTANIHIQSGFSLETLRWAFGNYEVGNWHPLTWLSHMLDCQLFGLKSWGHHLTNVLFHALNTLLLFLAFRQMTGAPWRSFFVAALFGLHPLHVESVAWVAERKDVLSGFFFTLTIWAYARGVLNVECRGPDNAARSTLHALRFYALAILFFALGLMSKPMLVTMPFVLLLLDYWPLGRVSSVECRVSSEAGNNPSHITHHASRILRLLLEKIPFLALSFASCAITFLVQSRAGAMDKMGGLPAAARLANALVAYCRYLWKLIWPVNLAVFYPHPGHWPAAVVAGAALLLVGITVVAIRSRRQRPWLFVGWLWFLGTLVPVIGLVQVGLQSMADRYTYIPAIGIFAALVWQAAAWSQTGPSQTGLTAHFASSGAAVILLLCAGLSFRQLTFWKNSEKLFRHALAVTPENNYIAHNNLGLAFNQQGRYAEAADEFQLAFAARSFNLRATRVYAEQAQQFKTALKSQPEDAELHERLGYALIKQNRFEQGMAEYEQAFRLRPEALDQRSAYGTLLLNCSRYDDAITQFREVLKLAPANAEANNGLGEALLRKGRIDEAITQLTQTIKLVPDSARAHANLGIALSLKGRLDEAITQYQEALKLKPDDANVLNNLGLALQSQGRLDEALAQLRRAVELNPAAADAHNNLGMALARKGRLEEANHEFAEALKIKPNDPKAHNNLGLGLSRLGHLDAAVFQFEETLKWTPDSAETHAALGVVLARQGKKEAAINHLRQALKLRPDLPEADRQLKALLAQ